MKCGFLVKGGVNSEDKKGVKEDFNDLQVQKFVLINFTNSQRSSRKVRKKREGWQKTSLLFYIAYYSMVIACTGQVSAAS